MEQTQNVQSQQDSALQQPRNDLQTGTGGFGSPNLNQSDLVTPELKVGNATIQPTGTAPSVRPVSSQHPYYLIPSLIALVVVVVILFWPENKEKPKVIEAVSPEVTEEPKKVTKPKGKKKQSRAKRKKTNR